MNRNAEKFHFFSLIAKNKISLLIPLLETLHVLRRAFREVCRVEKNIIQTCSELSIDMKRDVKLIKRIIFIKS